MKWKVEDPNKTSKFYDPEEVSIVMNNITLVNRKSTSNKIFAGANKTVCAWIECEEILIINPVDTPGKVEVRYNPRIQPNWVCCGEDVDSHKFSGAFTSGRKVYLTND